MTVDEKGIRFLEIIAGLTLILIGSFNGLRKNYSIPSPSVKQLKRGDFGEKIHIEIPSRPEIRDPIDGTTINYGSMFEIEKSLREHNNNWGMY
tara:strand:+ start:225 stop:503 length:279 start_codon:yes stop_codon:yes gene_type:complete